MTMFIIAEICTCLSLQKYARHRYIDAGMASRIWRITERGTVVWSISIKRRTQMRMWNAISVQCHSVDTRQRSTGGVKHCT
jgi:hypothetical protein